MQSPLSLFTKTSFAKSSQRFIRQPAIKFAVALAGIALISASCNLFSSTSLLGMVKSIDGGQTWKAASAASSGAGISTLDVSEMAFDSSSSKTIYLASTNGGLWETQDSANTWQQILSKITTYDFYVIPANDKIIYAAGIYNSHGKIVRSEDGGGSWTEIYNESSTNNSVNSIVADPSNPTIIYAGLNSGEIIKSTDGGVNWFVAYDFKDQVLKLRFDPAHNLYVLLKANGISESTDGGTTWNSITQPLTNISDYDTTTLQNSSVSSFVKFSLDTQASGIIFTTTSQGLFKTVDNGAHWSLINLPVNKTQPIAGTAALPRAVTSTEGGMQVYTSIYGTIYRSIDGGNSWQTEETPTTNSINKILIDPQNNSNIYAGLVQLQ
jgi:photosystem II stability/assembly factor-like uncharacterized protein